MENNNGLLIDETATIRGIEIPISSEPVTGFRRKAKHESLFIGPDLQMIQKVRIVKLSADGTDLCDQVRDTVDNTNVQSQLLNAYQDTLFAASTEGSKVDATGQPSAEGIEELRYFQGVTIGAIKAMGIAVTDETSVPMLVYLLLKSQIQKLDNRGQL